MQDSPETLDEVVAKGLESIRLRMSGAEFMAVKTILYLELTDYLTTRINEAVFKEGLTQGELLVQLFQDIVKGPK